jgi:hypothetical protein
LAAKEISMSTNTAHKQQQTAVLYARVASEEYVQGYSIQAQPAAGPGGRYDYVRQQVEE